MVPFSDGNMIIFNCKLLERKHPFPNLSLWLKKTDTGISVLSHVANIVNNIESKGSDK
jgi:hypothetical protein